jgi:hypothetical protein
MIVLVAVRVVPLSLAATSLLNDALTDHVQVERRQ